MVKDVPSTVNIEKEFVDIMQHKVVPTKPSKAFVFGLIPKTNVVGTYIVDLQPQSILTQPSQNSLVYSNRKSSYLSENYGNKKQSLMKSQRNSLN